MYVLSCLSSKVILTFCVTFSCQPVSPLHKGCSASEEGSVCHQRPEVGGRQVSGNTHQTY